MRRNGFLSSLVGVNQQNCCDYKCESQIVVKVCAIKSTWTGV